MFKFLAVIGRYFMLMGKVFSRPEKAGIYYRRVLAEIEGLGINSIPPRCNYLHLYRCGNCLADGIES